MTPEEERLQLRKDVFGGINRAVIKVGTGVLTHQQGLNKEVISRLAREISALMDQGIEIILVSSGAIGSGIKKIGLKQKPSDIPGKQAAAAVGQPSLMLAYEEAFNNFQKKVAQILLTRDDLCSRRRHLNARNTLSVLLGWGVLPVVNENDTVMVEELKFGDNDTLSAMITHMMDAQVLINLTDIDGLYDRDPRRNPEASLQRLIKKIDSSLERAAREAPGALGTGGMSSKVQAAKKVTTSGIPMVIASGLEQNVLTSLFEGQDTGTLFMPRKEKMACRKCWIAFTLKEKGVIRVDHGAAQAICKRGKSLLPIGIIDVEGEFGIGAMVRCVDPEGTSFARGLVNYKASEIRKLKGLKTNEIRKKLGHKHYDEVIHRDNLVMTLEEGEELTCQ